MKWLRRLLHLSPSDTDKVLDRADRYVDNVKSVRIVVVPKDDRARAELERLQAHARRCRR